MMNELEYEKIDKDMFEFVQSDKTIHDTKLDTKPIGYFKDAFIRFRKNKSSVVAFIIIVVLLLFAIFGPVVSKHTTTEVDGYYRLCLPKTTLFGWAGWDGAANKNVSDDGYDSMYGIFAEEIGERNNADSRAVKRDNGYTTDELGNRVHSLYIDSYNSVGFVYANLSEYDYFKLLAYQNKNNIQVIYPMIETYYSDSNANNWYKTKDYDAAMYYSYQTDASHIFGTGAARDENGNYVKNYMGTTNFYAADYVSLRLPGEYEETVDGEGNVTRTGKYSYSNYDDIKKLANGKFKYIGEEKVENGYYAYALRNQTGFKVRVLYNEYYRYMKTTIKSDKTPEEVTALYKDAAQSPVNSPERIQKINDIVNHYEVSNDGYYCQYIFGSNDKGKDIFVMLSSGARLSFILAICVSAINLTIGAIYGAIEGYFGGTADLIMERVSEILNEVPFIVVATLFKLHLAEKVGPLGSLLFAFVLTGWIGMAARTRMQFYRFKGQEYVLSSRTLGASDIRIMFKHIFPNAIGTLITGSVLSIPGVIFAESSLSYLHIIDLETSGFTSVGTLLSNGTSYVNTYPHVVLFPAIFISLLMVSFNLLGNGLRDAFNPSLRGVDE